METTSSIHKLHQDLECPLCLELYKNARSLICLHTFCHGCLVKYQGKQRVKNVLVCPTCREPTALTSGNICSLRLNTIVNSMADTWRAVVRSPGMGEENCQGSINGPSAEGVVCPIHKNERLDQFCCVCMVAVCRNCIIGDHRNHNFDDLGIAVGKMVADVMIATSATSSFLPKLENARKVLEEKEETVHLSEAATALKKEINMAADSALDFVNDEINLQRDALLATVDGLSSASTGTISNKIEQDAKTTYHLAQSVIDSPQKKTLSGVEVASIYPELRRKLKNMIESCLDGGLLDAMCGLQVPSFSPNPQLVKQINIGRLDHPTSWRLARTVSVPTNRIGEAISMKAAPNGKLAIGYKNGGVEIIDPLGTREHESILHDVKLLDFAFLQDSTIAIVTLHRKLFLFSQKNAKLDVTFNTPTTSGLMSVDVDDHGSIIVGFAEHRVIHVYSPDGGDPTKVIDLKDFAPWNVKTATMGRIISKDLNSIRVYDRSGAVKATISETPPLCSFATADKTGSIFVAVLRKSKQISVAKHRLDGTLDEIIMKEQTVYKIDDKKFWFSLSALSRDCLAVSDTRNIFIYRNIPVLPDLIELAK
ncbi:uncharacterized protein LOC129258399 [Lytechinus pictus]|uniref:uncharacterized protein LOC129258399 n=1 Tax=Lytechinus pictus TaxID=7653 RepID=UPI0030B9D4F2